MSTEAHRKKVSKRTLGKSNGYGAGDFFFSFLLQRIVTGDGTWLDHFLTGDEEAISGLKGCIYTQESWRVKKNFFLSDPRHSYWNNVTSCYCIYVSILGTTGSFLLTCFFFPKVFLPALGAFPHPHPPCLPIKYTNSFHLSLEIFLSFFSIFDACRFTASWRARKEIPMSPLVFVCLFVVVLFHWRRGPVDKADGPDFVHTTVDASSSSSLDLESGKNRNNGEGLRFPPRGNRDGRRCAKC